MKAAVFPGVCLALIVMLIPFPALASLGGNAASIEADRAHIEGTVEIRQSSAYIVHEIKSAAGMVVREYVRSSGVVFGVAWQGQFVPDLQQLLGPYFDQYSAGVKAQKATYVGRRPLNLQLPGLVVQRNGYMRAERGRAYVPNQVPPGVKLEEIW